MKRGLWRLSNFENRTTTGRAIAILMTEIKIKKRYGRTGILALTVKDWLHAVTVLAALVIFRNLVKLYPIKRLVVCSNHAGSIGNLLESCETLSY